MIPMRACDVVLAGRRGRGALGALLVALLVAGVTVAAAAPAGAQADGEITSAEGAAVRSVSLSGSVMETLKRPTVVLAPTTLLPGRKRVVVIDGRGIPDAGVGAVAVQLQVTGAREGGSVKLYAQGAAVPDAPTLRFDRGDSSSTAIVRVGSHNRIALRVAAASGVRVSVSVMSYLPETSDLVLVEPAVLRTARVGGRKRVQVSVANANGVPADAGAALVRLTALTPGRDGSASVFPRGAKKPVAATMDYGRGTTTDTLAVVAIGRRGDITLRNNASSRVRYSVEVLGWLPDGGPLEVPRAKPVLKPTTIGAGRKRTITLPAATRGGDAWLRVSVINPTDDGTVTVSKGAKPRKGAAALSFEAGSTTGAPVMVSVPKGRKITLKNTSAEGQKLRVELVGWSSRRTSEGITRMVLPGSTRLAGVSDVVASDPLAGTVTVRAGTDLPRVGGHLVIAPGTGEFAGVIGRVTAKTRQGANTVVSYTSAPIYDAFIDFETHYHGPVGTSSGIGEAGISGAGSAKTGMASALDGFMGFTTPNLLGEGPEELSCSVSGVPVLTSIGFGLRNLEADFDFDLSDRYVRATISGTAVANASVTVTPSTLSCQWTADFPGRIPAGWFGIRFSAGLNLSMSSSVDGTMSVTASAPATLGFEYRDGQTTNLSDIDFAGSGDTSAGSATLSITPFVRASLTLAVDAQVIDPAISLDLGTQYTFGPHPEHFGPRCAALTMAPTVNLSAGLEFFSWIPDVEFNVAQWSAEPWVLWRGPCTAYQGTITWAVDLQINCPTDLDLGRRCLRETSSVTATLDGRTPLSLLVAGGVFWITQPISWRMNFTSVSAGDLICPAYRQVGTGSGTWDPAADYDGTWFGIGSPEGWVPPLIQPLPVWASISQPARVARSGGCLEPSTTETEFWPVPFFPTPDDTTTTYTTAPNGIGGPIRGTTSGIYNPWGGPTGHYTTFTMTFDLTPVEA